MDQEQMMQELTNLVQAAMSGDQQAQQQIMQLKQAADNGDQQAAQIMQVIAQMMQEMQGGAPEEAAPQTAPIARKGAKLDYIKSLHGVCPEGYEKFAKGGKCTKCMKKEAPKMEEGGMTKAMCGIKAELKKKVVKDQKPAQPLQPKGQRSGKPMPTKYDAVKHERLAGLNKPTPAQRDSSDAYARIYRGMSQKEQERVEAQGRKRLTENRGIGRN